MQYIAGANASKCLRADNVDGSPVRSFFMQSAAAMVVIEQLEKISVSLLRGIY